MSNINRYEDIFNIESSDVQVPDYTIKDRETDIYVTFNDGDRLDNMSNRIYGYPGYWWIILSANNYTIEFDIEYGEILRVPFPLSEVIEEIREQS